MIENLLLCQQGRVITSRNDECEINFDLLVVAEGTRGAFTKALVGKENVVPVDQIAAQQLSKHPEKEYYYEKRRRAHTKSSK